MKQIDLAKATGLSKGAISNYVSGRYKPKDDIINKLAEALHCSEKWLLGYDVPMEQEEKLPYDEHTELSEGEKALLNLFSRIPEDKQNHFLQMIRVVLNIQE